MSLRWSTQDFEDWRLRQGAHAAPAPSPEADAKPKCRGPKVDARRGMNKTEAEFAQHLEYKRVAGELAWWAFEPFRIRLADGTFYRPDFATVDTYGRTEIFEVKGHMREAARVRLKVAVEKLPYTFYLVRKVKGKMRITKV